MESAGLLACGVAFQFYRRIVLAAAKPWIEAALGFVYPQVCQLCGNQRATAKDGYVCAQCWRGVQFIKPPFCDRCGLPFDGDITTRFECTNCCEMDLSFRFARSAVAATGQTLEVIHRYKYRQALWFEPFLADLMIRGAKAELSRADWDVIVPVPLHPLKQREREFNQAERLAVWLSRATHIPVNTRVLRRTIPTRTQTKLTKQQRAVNVRQAFAAWNGSILKDARVVVLDDVLTTGATASACARVLRQIGAADVCVWTVARGL